MRREFVRTVAALSPLWQESRRAMSLFRLGYGVPGTPSAGIRRGSLPQTVRLPAEYVEIPKIIFASNPTLRTESLLGLPDDVLASAEEKISLTDPSDIATEIILLERANPEHYVTVCMVSNSYQESQDDLAKILANDEVKKLWQEGRVMFSRDNKVVTPKTHKRTSFEKPLFIIDGATLEDVSSPLHETVLQALKDEICQLKGGPEKKYSFVEGFIMMQEDLSNFSRYPTILHDRTVNLELAQKWLRDIKEKISSPDSLSEEESANLAKILARRAMKYNPSYENSDFKIEIAGHKFHFETSNGMVRKINGEITDLSAEKPTTSPSFEEEMKRYKKLAKSFEKLI